VDLGGLAAADTWGFEEEGEEVNIRDGVAVLSLVSYFDLA
jgi:hypothetical protein